MKKLVMWKQDRRFMEFAKSIFTYFKGNRKSPLILNVPFIDEYGYEDDFAYNASVSIVRHPHIGKYVGVAQINMDNPDDSGEIIALEFRKLTDLLAIAWSINTNIDNDGFIESIERYNNTGVYKDE
ncbi:MAG: hypothetical protein ACRCXX_03990 [Cetobacterium sp.]|uniref:hypothetical protein n=1 Tax=Cetobacterium sp. TaxID=2071632 RepID=UPI003F30BB2D